MLNHEARWLGKSSVFRVVKFIDLDFVDLLIEVIVDIKSTLKSMGWYCRKKKDFKKGSWEIKRHTEQSLLLWEETQNYK